MHGRGLARDRRPGGMGEKMSRGGAQMEHHRVKQSAQPCLAFGVTTSLTSMQPSKTRDAMAGTSDRGRGKKPPIHVDEGEDDKRSGWRSRGWPPGRKCARRRQSTRQRPARTRPAEESGTGDGGAERENRMPSQPHDISAYADLRGNIPQIRASSRGVSMLCDGCTPQLIGAWHLGRLTEPPSSER